MKDGWDIQEYKAQPELEERQCNKAFYYRIQTRNNCNDGLRLLGGLFFS